MDIIQKLQLKFAFKEGVVKRKEDLNTKVKIVSIPMDEDWKKTNTESMWWANGFKGEFRKSSIENNYEAYVNGKRVSYIYDLKKLLEFKDILMSFGGDDVCLDSYEEDLQKLLTRGQLWIDKKGRIKRIKGQPNQCHRNSCNLWEQNKDKFEVHICTGYALSTDESLWRQHSWLVYIDSETGRSKIVETTVKWSAYFGYVMTEEECEKFVYQNY